MEGTEPGLYCIEVNLEPGAVGAKILNQTVPSAFRESVRVGKQNLYAGGKALVGDRDARAHQFTVQRQPQDNDKSATGLGLPVLAPMVGWLLDRKTHRATIIVGSLNLGGSLERIADRWRWQSWRWTSRRRCFMPVGGAVEADEPAQRRVDEGEHIEGLPGRAPQRVQGVE